MRYVTDTAILTVGIQCLIHLVLCAQLVAEHACGGRAVNAFGLLVNLGFHDGILFYILRQGGAVHALHSCVKQTTLCQLAHQIQHTSGTSTLLHAVLLAVRRQFAKERSLARETVNIAHGEVHLGFLCHGQQVQHGIGACAHGNVKGHGIEECGTGGNGTGQHAFVAILVIRHGILHNLSGSLLHQFHTIGMGGQDGSVSRQRKSQTFCQVVHAVGGEHARAASATGTGAVFHLCQLGIVHGGVCALDHGGNQIQILTLIFSGLHGTSGHKYGRDVQTHRRHQHSGGNLVAVGDADHGIGLVGVAHILYAVGNDVAAGQRIQHTVVAHCNTVVNGYGIEFCRIASHLLNLGLDNLSGFVQMGMSGNKLGKTVHNGNDRFAELFTLHSVGHPQGTRSCHTATFRADSAA